MDDKQVVKWLIVAAVVIIVVVEGFTVLGLFGGFLGGDGGDATPTDPGSDGGGTTPVDGVGMGEELLSDTDRTETLASATFQSGDRWTLTVSVAVSNTGEHPYELRLGDAVGTDGERFDGTATTGAIAPGENGTVAAQWSLPSGTTPDRIAVTAVEYPGDGRRVLVDRDVAIAHLPVQG